MADCRPSGQPTGARSRFHLTPESFNKVIEPSRNLGGRTADTRGPLGGEYAKSAAGRFQIGQSSRDALTFICPGNSNADKPHYVKLSTPCSSVESPLPRASRRWDQTRSVCDDPLVSVADHQTLRVLEGRYVLERAESDAEVARDGEVLAVVRGPDGGACMRRQDAADDAWVALWNGDEAHPPDATGMLAAIVAPLAAGNVPVWVAASFDGDIVLIPIDRLDEAAELLRRAGHRVIS